MKESRKRLRITSVAFIFGFLFLFFNLVIAASTAKTSSFPEREKEIEIVYAFEQSNTSTVSLENEIIYEDDEDIDPLSRVVYIEDEEETESKTEEILDSDDIDPLTYSGDEWYETDPTLIRLNEIFDTYNEYLETNVPFTVHFDRAYYMDLSENEQRIMSKIITCENGLTCFEMQAATAGIILNRRYSKAFPNDIYSIATAPKQFDESYAYAPWPEADTKTKAAIAITMAGIDFSCGGDSYYAPDGSTEAGIRYFKKSTTTTTEIYDRVFHTVFAVTNSGKADALSAQRYMYDSKLGEVIKL